MDRPALPKEDLFEASTMTFGEHLEELRKSLARALVWWAAGALVALLFAAKPAVRYIQGPLEKAIIEYKAERGIERYRSDENVDPEADPERLEQLRQMMIDQGVSWEKVWIVPRQGNIGFEGNTLAPQDTAPQGKDTQDTAPQGKDTQGKADASATASSAVDGGKLPAATDFVPVWILRPTEATLNAHKIEEPFMIYLKAAVVIGSLIASPMIFYHLWGFVAAGLYPHERRYVYIYLPFSVSLFIAGVALAFFAVLGFVLHFLLNFNSELSVDMEPRLSYFMSFVLLLPLGFGIAFQLPLVMLFLQRIGIFETSAYVSSWRISVLVIAVVSMVLTPADPYSMLLMMCPLVMLYFLGIGLCKMMPRGRGLGSAAYDPR